MTAARSDTLLLPGVLAVLAAAVALVGPGGDFPLSDDWAYGHVVRSLCSGGGFDFLPWTGATVVFQALAGAAACKVAGFSYEVLRATTLIFSLAGVAALFALLRETGAVPRTAAAAAATLALSPLWFHLSFTFMTEVPFAALVVAAAWAYARAFAPSLDAAASRRLLIVGAALCTAAFLVRQQAAPLAAAAALAALLPATAARGGDRGVTRRLGARVVDAACAAALPALCALAWAWWALTSDAVPPAVHNKLREASSVSAWRVADVVLRGWATLGFLFLPWAATLKPGRDFARRAFAAVAVALAAGALALWWRDGSTMFYLPNVLDEWTVGALTTRDTQFLGHHREQTTSLLLRAPLTLASLWSAAVLGAVLARVAAVGDDPRRRQAAFLVLALVLSAAASLVQTRYYFDRYLVAMLPLAIAAAAVLAPRARPGAAFAATWLALAAYGVAGTHDYMEWNRARWNLLAALEARGVAATSIDGGFEYNAERLAARLGTSPSDTEARRGQDESAKSWWWVVDDEWVVAFRPLGGYAVAEVREYPRWLPAGRGRVLALHRETAAAGAP